MSSLDVIVLGGGAMGTAAGWHLARHGLRVAVLEQFTPGHDRGSSHGATRVVRQAYYEHPDYVPLLRRSYALFRETELAIGQSLLEVCGGLFCGKPEGEVVRGAAASAELHGIPHERLDAAEIARRWPALRLDEGQVGVWEPGAGYCYAERTVRAQATLAMDAGARVTSRIRVRGWTRDGDGVRVDTDDGVWSADVLVVTAGAWAPAFLDLPLRVSRQVLGWVEPAPKLPVWLVEEAGGLATYSIPAAAEGPAGMKIAVHGGGATTTATEIDRRVSAADRRQLRDAVERRVRGGGRINDAAVCMYTNSPDGHFVIDEVDERVWAAVGFSGHGFKFAPVVGEMLAELVATGQTRYKIDLFRAARFGG